MTTIKNSHATTFSMIIAHVIAQRCKVGGMTMNAFYKRTGISQASWSRLARGQTRFDIEDLRIIERSVHMPISEILQTAEQVEQKAKREGIKIIEPYTTQNKSDLAEVGLMIVAGAVLGFMALQVIKSK